jgi:uncharacterized protein (TIGR02147 family)
MNPQLALQNALHDQLMEIQRKNPRYSMRSYAKKVGVHIGALSSIINGKRNVSRKLAERIVRRMLLDPQRRSEILRLFPDKQAQRGESGAEREPLPQRYLVLRANQFKIAAEWEHFAVMSLVRCADAQSGAAWIASRLGITELRAQQVVDRLLELGILVRDESGKLTRSDVDYRTTDDVADIAGKRHHEETLELAKESMHRDPIHQRDLTTTTMAFDREDLGAAKELIRKFHDDIADLAARGKRRAEVYRLAVQLFPMTKLEK